MVAVRAYPETDPAAAAALTGSVIWVIYYSRDPNRQPDADKGSADARPSLQLATLRKRHSPDRSGRPPVLAKPGRSGRSGGKSVCPDPSTGLQVARGHAGSAVHRARPAASTKRNHRRHRGCAHPFQGKHALSPCATCTASYPGRGHRSCPCHRLLLRRTGLDLPLSSQADDRNYPWRLFSHGEIRDPESRVVRYNDSCIRTRLSSCNRLQRARHPHVLTNCREPRHPHRQWCRYG